MAYQLALKKENFKFAASHFTIFSESRAEALHGHNYQIGVRLGFDDIDEKLEMKVDFGSLKEKIRAVIRDHIVPIRHCYEKELKNRPKLSGKLVMEWDIGELGKVTRVASVKGFDTAVDACIAGVIKNSLFETPPKGTTGNVRFPFTFSPNPEKSIK